MKVTMGETTTYDVCVVGSGVAGSTIAALLGRRGYRVAVIEQNWSEPDEIIGELLQPSGAEKLRAMGFDDAFEGYDAQPIFGYAMFLDGESIRISYPDRRNHEKEDSGYGFRYGRFVQKLRSYLDGHDNIDKIEGKVMEFTHGDDGSTNGVTYLDSSRSERQVRAHLTIVSQGSASKLRTDLNQAELKVKGYMMGMILEGAKPPFENHGHVVIANPAPVLVYPVGTGKLRVLIDFPKGSQRLKGEELNNYLLNDLMPQLPVSIHDAFKVAVAKGQFKYKATYLLAARPVIDDNVVLLGDSLNQRHPTTGGGMTVALTDAQALGNALTRIDISDKLARHRAIQRFYKNRYKENATINILAYALYRVFRHPQLSRACFNYLKKGGKFAAEPMSILSGKSRNRRLLIQHFFQVAFFGAIDTLRPLPTPVRIARSFSMLKDAVIIITPLLIDEFPLRAFRPARNMRIPEKMSELKYS